MTNKELIEKLLNYPLDAEIIKSYTIQDEEGEEYNIEEEPLMMYFQDAIYL